MTPDQVHYGQAEEVHAARQRTLDRAFRANPERFVKKPPEPPAKPTAVWINPPQKEQEQPSLIHHPAVSLSLTRSGRPLEISLERLGQSMSLYVP